MVWSAAAAERPSPRTTVLILPPLPVPLIAEQWDEQLPPAAAVPRLEDDDEEDDEEEIGGAQAKTDTEEKGDAQEQPQDSAQPPQDLARHRSASPPTTSAKRKREDSAAADGSDRSTRLRAAHTPAPLNLAPSRHPKLVQPTDQSHPYNQPTQLTPSHLAPDVLAAAQSIAARQGIKLDIPLEDASLDVRAYNDALVDPATVGSGAVAQAKAMSARKRFAGSVDGLSAIADGLGTSASPAPGGTPGPSGAQTPVTASPALGSRTPVPSNRKNKGHGRWGHLYAKRAQQAAAAKAEKERSALVAAGVALEEPRLDAEVPIAAPVASDAPPSAIEITPEDMAEQKEKEERERAEQAEAARAAAEEKKRETMAKALGSASYWNHLLIEARRQRGPQWDVNTQLYQVDRGSALYYSDVRGPPPTPPPVEQELPDPTKVSGTPVSTTAPLPATNGMEGPTPAPPQPALQTPMNQQSHHLAIMQQQQEILRRQQQMQFEQQQRQQQGSAPPGQGALQPQHSGPYQQPQATGQQLTPRQQMQRLGSIPNDQQPGRAMSGTPGSEHGSQARPQSSGRQGSVPQVAQSVFAQNQQQQPNPAQMMQMMQGMQGNAAGSPSPMRPPAAMPGGNPALSGQYSQAQLAQMHRQLQQMQQKPQQQQQQQPGMQGGQPQINAQGMQNQSIQQLQAQQLQAQMAQKQREMLQARMNGLPTTQYAGQMQQQKPPAGMSVGLNGNATFPAMPQGMSPQQLAALQAQAQGNRQAQAQFMMQQANPGMYNGMATQGQPGNMMGGGKMPTGGNGGGQSQLTPLQMQQMYAQYQAANQGR